MEHWTTEIQAQQRLITFNARELWRYRDLLGLLVKRDFVSFYKQTILGPLWFFIQPLFTTVIYTFIFGNLAGISTDGLPQPLFYMAGITLWNYFADCLLKTSTVFKDNANIFGKVYFPRLIMPLSIVVSNLVRFGVQFLLFLLFLGYYWWQGAPINFTTWVLAFPLLVVFMAILGLGLGMTISAMTTKYRDLAFLLSFGIQLLMYATTVIYPLTAAPEKYKWIIELNPMTTILEAFRLGFLGEGTVTAFGLIYSVVFTISVFIIGSLIFNKVERSFVDTI